MSSKTDFLDALCQVLPDDVLDRLDERLPTIPNLPAFSDADSAIMTMAAFCENQNTFLQQFSNLPFIAMLFMGCSLNPTLQTIALASLQVGTEADRGFSFIYPIAGEYKNSASFVVVINFNSSRVFDDLVEVRCCVESVGDWVPMSQMEQLETSYEAILTGDPNVQNGDNVTVLVEASFMSGDPSSGSTYFFHQA